MDRSTLKTLTFPVYIPGERVRLVRMDDKQAPPIGTQGTIKFCTDHGDWQQIGIKWDNGSGLMAIIPDDKIERIA